MKRPFLTRSRELRKNQTDAENLLWMVLRAHRLNGYKFRRQQVVGPFIVDFVCMREKLIVEVDGGHHMLQKEYDEERRLWLEAQGFRVVRFWNSEVLGNLTLVADEILRQLIPSP